MVCILLTIQTVASSLEKMDAAKFVARHETAMLDYCAPFEHAARSHDMLLTGKKRFAQSIDVDAGADFAS